ncbi:MULTISPECIES: hypothetical protein [Mesorhizobium]|nr:MULTISPECIES: hypothetical protein [Mesorhizobium]RUZ58424.1 hypothetical protein EN956_01325 [Mesorhizobium sp. M7A.F.Ca.CA.004.05.2.1]MCF6121930.1 hypothetical protein [Mesorhizobium ciceri]MCQ8812511.1 hypothetical protein [Mesorhizobium sp. SEMIA396]RUX80586.1 hypothetical protein EN983_07555 [Mesorhizobium sp. M7A.F.Ca.CA.004.08.2.1]RUX87264.1 hypothetical protein EN982_11570 [Mesorhizobium sp. M7A.F.Ca.CA.004.08.1.1]
MPDIEKCPTWAAVRTFQSGQQSVGEPSRQAPGSLARRLTLQSPDSDIDAAHKNNQEEEKPCVCSIA